jgi:coenzyme F420-reducing hydrogenase beta subunit/SAM-dependent methyltransferase
MKCKFHKYNLKYKKLTSLQEKESFIMKYSEYFTEWLEGIKDEISFWDSFMRNKGGELFYGFAQTTDPRRPFTLDDDIPDEYKSKNYSFIDIGSGPFGRCGRVSSKSNLHITTVDPLAYIYRRLKNEYGLDNNADLKTGFVEFLDYEFNENSFDMVHMSNSLDHSFDPVLGIWQCIRICRIGGKIILRHHPNEAENEQYCGFHQWNLCIENNEFIIWRPGEYHNISKLIQPYADIYAYPNQKEGAWNYDKVVLIKKCNVRLPESEDYYGKAMNMIYERMLQQIFDFQVNKNNDMRLDESGRIVRIIADMYLDSKKFNKIRYRFIDNKPISIYGMGMIGRSLTQLFLKYKIPVNHLIDQKCGEYNNNDIINIENYFPQKKEILIVASVKKAKELTAIAKQKFKNLTVLSVSKLVDFDDPFLIKKEYGTCTGCSACIDICPENAITMKEDSEAFLIPDINHDKCIHCGKCEKLCMELTKLNRMSRPFRSYAAMADLNLRQQSSSGGMFSVLAKKIIAEDGKVAGAIYTDDYKKVVHIISGRMQDIDRMCGSKYVQSEKIGIYRIVKTILEKNQSRPVLFSGCPCEVHALRTFLGKSYSNLFCLDIFCHGVPSAKEWDDYLSEICNGSNVSSVNFRDKKRGWSTHLLLLLLDGQPKYIEDENSAFYSLFLNRVNLRKSCYNCSYAREERVGDISIGDFWGIENKESAMYDGIGTSAVLINTEKGEYLFDQVRKELKTFETSLSDINNLGKFQV